MKKEINVENVKQFKLLRQSLNFIDAVKEANRCLMCEDAPCTKNCPASTNPGKFIRQIKFENYKGAARTIKNNNPLGSVCAHICPVEKLCEKACCMHALEDPINIAGLQQFACDYGKANSLEDFEPSKKTSGKVVVIGAGPSGISCAFELAKLDYDVTIFEKESHCGGVARWNIPEYRLPTVALEEDLKSLQSLGVSIKYNSPMNTVDEMAALLKDGFSAVFIAIGLSCPVHMPLLKDYENALDYENFLRQIKTSKEGMEIQGKNVVVIGGGSSAMDAACSAAALDATVTVIYRRTTLEMPAYREEIELAHKIGVNFKTNSTIVEVFADEKSIHRIRGTELKWKNKGSANAHDAQPIDGAGFELNVDLIIQAIGAQPIKTSFNPVDTTDKGAIKVGEDFSTNIAGIFSGGDIINGGATVAQAIGEGKKAANSIHTFIRSL